MNILKEIKISTCFESIKQSYRSLTGKVDKITDVYLTPGQQSIRYLKQIDKGNAKQLSKIKLVFQHASGYYSLMPFLYKSYDKLVKEIEYEMNKIGGQRVLLPSLYQIDLLKESDRFDILKNELFTLTGRQNKEMYLAPTNEEPITSIVASSFLNHKQVPLLLYQIDSKFRNELRPRFGLLRANQFIMKDLYSFDKDQESAFKTYEKVCSSYEDLFNRLELNFIKVKASNGLIGGKFSHEFHLVSKYGEDDIYLCKNCKTAYNKETLIEDDQNDEKQNKDEHFKRCPECKDEMEHQNSIEIAHTFYLGTKYSEKMNALFLDYNTSKLSNDTSDAKKRPLEMCCFGIGVTRILSAIITQSETTEIDWPIRIAPYHALIISPKKGSKENIDEIGTKMADSIAKSLKNKGFDILIDNREELTIGRRQIDSLAYGFPFKIIIGRESIEEIPKFEFYSNNQKSSLTHSELIGRFDEISKQLK